VRPSASLAAFAAVAALAAWSALSVVNAFGTITGGLSAASSAFEYQYSGSVSGGGTIASPVRGQITFNLNAKLDTGVTSGSCSATEPTTKTKVKCLDVTSLTIVTLDAGRKVAVVKGFATVNDVLTTYEIQVVDDGNPGVGKDSFSIVAGGFQRSGVLTGGSISILL
jgi:hypothetical protein